MAGNRNLHDSAKNKQDEFYTNLTLVEDELKHYRAHFRGARVLCNCDDPYESNFFKYFAMNFNVLGLKSLTATCYATSPVVCTQLDLFGDGTVVKPRRGRDASRRHQPYKIVITEVRDENQDGRIDLSDVEWLIRNRKNVLTRLAGDGDFRSPECVALLDEADIVVTNPQPTRSTTTTTRSKSPRPPTSRATGTRRWGCRSHSLISIIPNNLSSLALTRSLRRTEAVSC